MDIDQQLNGAEVTVTPQVIDRDLAGLLLHNYGEMAAVCTAVFRNGQKHRVPGARSCNPVSARR